MAAKRSTTRALELYGQRWPFDHPARVELAMIRHGLDRTQPNINLAHHLEQFTRYVWPWIAWHRWTRLLVSELVKPCHRLGVFGPSSSQKSCPVGMIYLTYYLARPNNTIVLVSSTTRDELDVRIWGEILRLWREAKEQFDWIPGYLTESKQMISTDGKEAEFGREKRNGLMARPCKIGNKWVIASGTSPFVGIKNDNVYVAADELGLMPPGIIDAIANLTSNPSFCFSGLGNLGDLDTPLASICEPVNGWSSIPDSPIAWAYDTRWTHGRAIQFVGLDSPNLDYPEGAEPYKKLIGREYIADCARDFGVDTPLYNMFAAGKIPRGTLENRVITDALCLQWNAYEPVEWGHEPLTRLYCLDVSYTADHGDKTVGRPLAFGKDMERRWKLAPLEAPHIYTPSDRGDRSIEDQLATEMMAECLRLGIPPSRVFFDGTGRSSFTAAVMRLPSWLGESPTSVNPVEFGGTATTRPNFLNRRYDEDLDVRRKKGELLPCAEVFGKMVSELWFAWPALVTSDQCRGLDRETVKQGAKRLWKLTAGNRIDVEPKGELKKRLGRSCDEADCLVVGLEGARRLGFPLGQRDVANTRRPSGWLSRMQRDWREAQAAQELAVA